jgi:two-component sensor histidine kinase
VKLKNACTPKKKSSARSLAEKEVLLQEIHHRVKDNLQIVSSLIDLQARHTEDEQILEMFRESRDRIRTMALAHEKLYQSDDLAHIDLPGYIRTLATDLMHSYSISTNQIESDIHIDDIALEIDMAMPCGLIINELLSNALKYAFPDNRPGCITLELRQVQPGSYLLRVADNGAGPPEGMDYEKTDSSRPKARRQPSAATAWQDRVITRWRHNQRNSLCRITCLHRVNSSLRSSASPTHLVPLDKRPLRHSPAPALLISPRE